MWQRITDDLDALLGVLPPPIREAVLALPDRGSLLEIVLDLGRPAEARFLGREVVLTDREVSREDIEYIVSRIGAFTTDNRAGIGRTLHRISAIRNRAGQVVGLTCRVGRAVFDTIKIIGDLMESGENILLLGRPGVGKTTMLREAARVLAEDMRKRVIVVDTSNEIAGDGDIPHSGIGRARRMQVPVPSQQHAVMIEAVENHMPQTIVIDEIGTELEAQAARTIAERGVQLIGTAHGSNLENLIANPTLCDLVGGVQSVTLGDEEAHRRGTQKSILERKAPPTFDIVVEIQDWYRVTVYRDVTQAIDAILRGETPEAERRWLTETGEIGHEKVSAVPAAPVLEQGGKTTRVYLYGVDRSRLESAAGARNIALQVVKSPADANLVLTTRRHYQQKNKRIKDAEASRVPIYVLRSTAPGQIERCLDSLYPAAKEAVDQALGEAEKAIDLVERIGQPVELAPQANYIRRLQHMLAEEHSLASRSVGREPQRRVVVSRPAGV